MNTFEGWAVMIDGHISRYSLATTRRDSIERFLTESGRKGIFDWRRCKRRGWRCRRIVIMEVAR